MRLDHTIVGPGLLILAFGGLLALDSWAFPGAGIAFLYAAVVLIAGLWLDRKDICLVAVGGTLMVALGWMFSFEAADKTMAVLNHGLALAMIWMTCRVLWLQKQREVNVKRLTGLLPMCSQCKKVRDDKGLWNQVEQYFEEHSSDLQFTHGLCPPCSRQLYPELFPKLSEQHPELYNQAP
jgi:hypothetical protein